MDPLIGDPSTPPPPVSQTHSPRLDSDPSSSLSEYNIDKNAKDVDSSSIQNNTKRKRRKAPIDPDVPADNVRNINSSVQSISISSSSELELATDRTENSKLPVTAVSSNSSSPTSSAPASKLQSSTKSQSIENTEQPATTQNSSSQHEKTKEGEKFSTIKKTLSKGKSLDNTNSSQQSKTEKVPKSSLRKTSSTRSALSLVFDISQNQTISRSTSAASSRCESRQGKYHVECQPVEDPDLKVENWSRVRSAWSPRARSSSSTRPGSEVSLLGRRESVTNLIFAGQSQIDTDEGGLETIYWKKLQLQYTPRNSLPFKRMSTSLKENDVTPGNFHVMVDEDYSLSRQSKVNTPASSARGSSSCSPSRSRTGFLYQVTDFDRLSKDVPAFVKHYAQKNGKMITESFILRLNYLRRRRQLGENSSTINIGNNNNNNNSGHGQGHGHSHSAGNLNTVGKRSSPTAAV